MADKLAVAAVGMLFMEARCSHCSLGMNLASWRHLGARSTLLAVAAATSSTGRGLAGQCDLWFELLMDDEDLELAEHWRWPDRDARRSSRCTDPGVSEQEAHGSAMGARFTNTERSFERQVFRELDSGMSGVAGEVRFLDSRCSRSISLNPWTQPSVIGVVRVELLEEVRPHSST